MKCPDCKGNVELEDISYMTNPDWDKSIELNVPYFKCPKCKQEYDMEDLYEKS